VLLSNPAMQGTTIQLLDFVIPDSYFLLRAKEFSTYIHEHTQCCLLILTKVIECGIHVCDCGKYIASA